MRMLDAMPREVVERWRAMAVLDGWLVFEKEAKPQSAEQMRKLLAARCE